MDRLVPFTAYEEANNVLEALLPAIRAIVGSHFIGMYLFGSLTYGGFDRSSDVDYIVVTEEELTAKEFEELKDMHRSIAGMDNWCATQLEGHYTPRQALREFVPERALYYFINRGEGETLERMQLDSPDLQLGWWGGWVILRATLLQHGIRLAGPPLETLLEPVSAQELREATLANIPGWAEPLLQEPQRIGSHGYQAYIVLTLCRMMYTLQKGVLASKKEAADWASETLGEPWNGLIERAWKGRAAPQGSIPPEDLRGTLAMIDYLIDWAKKQGEDHETKPEKLQE
jgi:hypothetical protein